jgi:hypothetical protein
MSSVSETDVETIVLGNKSASIIVLVPVNPHRGNQYLVQFNVARRDMEFLRERDRRFATREAARVYALQILFGGKP